jgi:Membrane carboxypeptidase/penicillin-binding protein
MFKLINFSVKVAIIILVTSILLLFSAFFYFSSGLPDYKKLSNYQPPISSRVYSKEGSLIAENALEKRLFVPFDSGSE